MRKKKSIESIKLIHYFHIFSFVVKKMIDHFVPCKMFSANNEEIWFIIAKLFKTSIGRTKKERALGINKSLGIGKLQSCILVPRDFLISSSD